MPPLYEQRAKLIDEVTKLVLEWLSLLDDEGKYNLISSMVRRYSLTDLRSARGHANEQVAKLRIKMEQADGRD